jgi:rhodanese-related sulfurtransferase
MQPITRTSLRLNPVLAPVLALTLALGACSGEPNRKDKSDGAPAPLPYLPALASAKAATGAATGEAVTAIRDVSVEEANALIAAEAPVTVLDLRTPEEFVGGHIKGAINLDATSEDFVDQLGALRKDRTYLIHCRSGRRSSAALETMREADFAAIAHMDDGMIGWEEAGLPVVP